jgi:hypothetical protein
VRKIAIAFALLSSFLLQATTGPGCEVTDFKIAPKQEPVFAAALEAWSNSDAAKNITAE